MTGQLNEFPLAELIREIFALRLSGALRLARERAKVVIYFDAGAPVYAVSNLRVYRLSECVRRWRVLTEQQLASAQNGVNDLEFGKALLETGALDREGLNELIEHQVSEMLCSALLWTDGEWEYDPRVRLAEDVRADIKTEELLMEAARRLPADLVASRLRGRDGRLSINAEAKNALALLPTEAFVLSRVESSLSLNELLALSGLPEAETLCLVYALSMGGFLSYDNWPRALTDAAVALARSVIPSKTEPARIAPLPKVPVVETKPEPKEEVDEASELEALFSRMDMAQNYYQILGVVRPTKDADIKRAYHSMAKRFHPDRFRKSVDGATHARIETAFARIAQAYETLKDKNTRAVYDSKLLKQEEIRRSVDASTTTEPGRRGGHQEPTGAAPSNNKSAQYLAEEKFQQGLTALRNGKHTLAIACLGDAARLEPKQPRYRAYFGQALAGDERLRRNAEAEFKAAVALDANNAAYRVMLAEFYKDNGLQKRAQAELERALTIDPNNQAARRLLDKMKR